MAQSLLSVRPRAVLAALVASAVLAGVSVGPAGAIHPTNVPPQANDDAYSTTEATPLTVAAPGVLGNDGDPDALVTDSLTAGSASDPAGGSVTLNADGSFSYTPDAGFVGRDSFTYTASDGHGGTDTATVTITVTGVRGGTYGYYTNVGLFGGPRTLRGQGTNVASTDESYAASVALPSGGSSTPLSASDPNGSRATYGPAVLFGGIWPDNLASGPVSGPISVSTQGTAGEGSVTSSAHAVLDAGVAGSELDPANPGADGPGGIGPGPLVAEEAHSTCTADATGVSGSATFVNGVVETKYDSATQLPVVAEPIPANPPPNWTRSGTLDHIGDRFTIVINEQIIGPDSITVNAAHMYLLGKVARGDMVVGSSTCSLISSVANATPVANSDAFSTAEDTPLTLSGPGVLANDTDADANPLTATNAQAVFVPGPDEPGLSGGTTYSFPSDPPNGTATINADGSLTYVPDADFFGTDTFTYVARDARGASDNATVTVTVTGVADVPVATDDFDQAVENTPLVVAAPGVLANDTDGDGETLTAGAASDPAHGTVALDANGSYTYTPEADFVGTDTFTYTVSDPTGRTDTATVTILVTVDGATLVKDINPGTSNSSPANVRAVGTTVFFSASNGFTNGTELWKTDGTPAGTVMVRDILPGFASSSPANLTAFNGALYFSANNGTGTGQNGTEVWRSDGTAEGTALVKDINAGTASSNPGNFRVVGNTLFFSASNGTASGQHGIEVWKTDGTTAGTVMVADINAGTASSSPGNFGTVGTTLFFSANNGTNGTELWKTDGTAAGTVMVADINAGTSTASGSPNQLTTLGSTLFFRATNGATTGRNGAELWKTDGTAAGTVMVKDINVGTASSNPSGFTEFNNKLLFSATDGTNGVELWQTDGTAAGTAMVANIHATGDSTPNQFRVFGPMVLFSAKGGGDSKGFELWKTDGTEAGTSFVKDINPGSADSFPSALTVVGDVVYLSATTGAKGAELWKTDGTAAGTVMAEDLNPGVAGSHPRSFTPALSTVVFEATDAANGIELWRLADSNQAPVAGDDSYTTDEDAPLIVAAPGLLANDTDADGEALTAGLFSPPANGTVALNPDGSFTYTPNANFAGTDSFTYTASDGNGGSDTATVTLTVNPLNDAPSATDDAYSTAAGSPLTVTAPGVLGNDTDVDGGPLSAGSATDPAGGNVVLNADGSFTYTPDAGFAGTDTFAYTASDGQGGSDTAAVAVTVTPPPPTGDTRPTQLSVSDVWVPEGNAGTTTATFTVTRLGVLSGPSTVKVKTSGGTATAGSDYTALALSTLSFAPGESSKTVTVQVTGDGSAEKDETLNVVLSSPTAAVIADATGVATVVNDDGAAYLGVNSVTVTEGNEATTPATFTVSRSGNTTGPSSVKYRTAAGTATADDFAAIALTTVDFAASETTKTVTVNVTGDTADEKNESFTVVLSAPVGAVVSDAAGTATIVDDEGTVTPGPATFVSVADFSLTEGNDGPSPATFTLTRSGDTTVASSVKYKTSGGTASPGVDYTAITTLGTVNFAAGETTKTLSVEVAGDALPEANETLNLVLSTPTGATIADTSATATILNDDRAAYLSVDDVSVTEGNSGTTAATFTIARSGNTNGASTVKYQTRAGTAATADFTAVGLTSVTFAAGETTKTVSVDVTGDSLDEANERFTLALSTPVGATTSDASGAATIVNDD